MFERNLKEREALAAKHAVVIGCGSVGSAVAEILVRAGIGTLVLVDPDRFSEENLGRHTLTRSALGRPKAEALHERLCEINPDLDGRAVSAKFDPAALGFGTRGSVFDPGRESPSRTASDADTRPDLLVSAVDSYRCESRINGLSLAENIPAVYVGCWGAASVGEIYYVVPRRTACYECFAGFRQKVEIPADARRYTDPDFDDTRIPGQAGLWGNILAIAGVAFQVILGLYGLRPDVIDHTHNLWLFNVSDHTSELKPLAVTFGTVQKGCAVCDESRLEDLTLEG